MALECVVTGAEIVQTYFKFNREVNEAAAGDEDWEQLLQE